MVPALIRSEQLSPRQEINLEGQPTSGLEIEIHLQVGKKKEPQRKTGSFSDMWRGTSSMSGCCFLAVIDTEKCSAASP